LSNTFAGMKVTLIGRGGSAPVGRSCGIFICCINSSGSSAQTTLSEMRMK
jgi:hypothetical protein